MAGTDLIKVQRTILDTTVTPNTTTLGVEERTKVSDILSGAPATATAFGSVKQMTFTANVAAAPTQADFNNLLAKLIASGQMAAS